DAEEFDEALAVGALVGVFQALLVGLDGVFVVTLAGQGRRAEHEGRRGQQQQLASHRSVPVRRGWWERFWGDTSCRDPLITPIRAAFANPPSARCYGRPASPVGLRGPSEDGLADARLRLHFHALDRPLLADLER